MRNIYLILITLSLSACVTGKYQNFKSGVGYEEEKLGNAHYEVSYTGTSSTNIKKVNDFAFLRSAEITRELGYKYFAISEAVNNGSAISGGNVIVEGRPTLRGFSPTQTSRKSKLATHMYHERPDGISHGAEQIERALKDEYSVESES